MELFKCILLGFLIVCAVAAGVTKMLLFSIVMFLSYSLIMSIVWLILQSPDLAITEAAIGAGVTSVLFFITLKKIHLLDVEKKHEQEEMKRDGGHETQQ